MSEPELTPEEKQKIKDASFKTIDGVNYTRLTIPSANGPMQIEGLTVRALRAALEKADPDSMITYIAEQDGGLLFGCIAGAAMTSPDLPITVLFGPEGVRAIAAIRATEL